LLQHEEYLPVPPGKENRLNDLSMKSTISHSAKQEGIILKALALAKLEANIPYLGTRSTHSLTQIQNHRCLRNKF